MDEAVIPATLAEVWRDYWIPGGEQVRAASSPGEFLGRASSLYARTGRALQSCYTADTSTLTYAILILRELADGYAIASSPMPLDTLMPNRWQLEATMRTQAVDSWMRGLGYPLELITDASIAEDNPASEFSDDPTEVEEARGSELVDGLSVALNYYRKLERLLATEAARRILIERRESLLNGALSSLAKMRTSMQYVRENMSWTAQMISGIERIVAQAFIEACGVARDEETLAALRLPYGEFFTWILGLDEIEAWLAQYGGDEKPVW